VSAQPTLPIPELAAPAVGGSAHTLVRLAFLAGFLCLGLPLRAQDFDKMSGDQLMALMRSAPQLATDQAVDPSASFDPPVIAAGAKAMYRVTLHTLDEAITHWADKMPVAPQLELVRGAQGMMFTMGAGKMQPLTVVNFHVTAATPGNYVVPAYTIEIYGQPVTIPEARLQVVAGDPGVPPLHELLMVPEQTNVYVGQPVHIRVLSPAGPNRAVQMLSQVQLNGDGFITGKGDVRQQISQATLPDGSQRMAFIYDTSLTPFAQGPLKIAAQAFTSGNQFGGQIVIQGGVVIPGGPPRFDLLEAAPVTLNVQPLPAEGRLPGFIGAVGSFMRDTPQLSATAVQAGNPVKLSVTFRGGANIAHLAMPPAPGTPAWQGFADGPPVIAGNSITFNYTLIPQTEQTSATPEIPFSYFDPDVGQYEDLSIPSLPIKVLPGAIAGTNDNLPVLAAEAAPEPVRQLSALAALPGGAASSLVPLQERGWFFLLEIGPVVVLGAIWLESRRRQFWEHHPDLRRRRDARRALQRERHALQQAAQTGDDRAFVAIGIQAIRLACAPHFPAEPRALVCGDVLQLLPEIERNGESGRVVRRLFTATDAQEFAGAPAPFTGLLDLQPQLDRLLTELEARI